MKKRKNPSIRQRIVTFLKYSSVSLTAAVIDYGLFCLITALLREQPDTARIWCATAVARVISCAFNYTLTSRMVFKTEEAVKRTLPLFGGLTLVQLCLSAVMVLALTRWSDLPSAVVKPLVDTALFFVSYRIQNKWIF